MPSPQPAPGRACGECMLCCKLPAIAELAKPAGTWCQHCVTRKGCNNYENRPTPCRTFNCLYLMDAGIGEEWHPAKARMFLTVQAGGGSKNHISVMVDHSRPDAWRKAPYYAQFKAWSAEYYVIVHVGERKIVLFPDHEADLGIMGEGDVIDMVPGTPGSGIALTAQVRGQLN